MSLKKQYLNIKHINEITPEKEVMFYNELDWEDEEILKHYRLLTKDINCKKAKEKLDKELERGFEVPWLIRKNKKS